jgi:hypothetical protein
LLLRQAKQQHNRRIPRSSEQPKAYGFSWAGYAPSQSITSRADRLLYNPPVPETTSTRLDRVLAQLTLYEHPLLNFSARSKGEGVEIIIQFKDSSVPVHTYYFELHPRDLDHPQFEWSFQRQLYDALHDYFVEMFIRTPQDRLERRQREL